MVPTDEERIDRIVDNDRAWFQKEEWANAAATLRQLIRDTEGGEKAKAQEALQAHYGNRGKEVEDWAPLVKASLGLAEGAQR